ncbi:MAG: methyltransferase domain-containing protein [Nanoarchaeota archaeon]
MSKKKYYGRERICESFIDKNVNGKILNLGAGEMQWLENDVFLGNKNFISSDIDENNLDSKNKANMKVKINATNIPFKDGEISEVIILDVLEHIKDHEKVLDEIYRVLKKGGILIISVPNDTLLSYLNPIRYAQHERHYKIKQLTGMLEKRGFRIEKVHAGGRIWELADLYTHLLIKYTTGKIVNLQIFNKLRDREYSKHLDNGNEIAIKAIKK